MFGRPIAGAQIPEGGDIILAVGSRPSQLNIYHLDPTDGSLIPSVPNVPNPRTIELAQNARKLVVAYFNDDPGPDFVVAGRNDIQILLSPNYEVEVIDGDNTLLLSVDGSAQIAATNDYLVVADSGGGRRVFGEVFVYEVVGQGTAATPTFELSHTLTGQDRGINFARGVGLGDVTWPESMPDMPDMPDGILELIVGAPNVGSSKKNLGHGVLELPQDFRPGMDTGWASTGVGLGSIGGKRSAIIGAPNANCEGEGSTGIAYLYVGIDDDPLAERTPTDFFGFS